MIKERFAFLRHGYEARETPFTCYLVAPVQLEPHFQIGPDCYVGSTILRLSQSLDTRIRKLRQLLVMQPVHAELMLHGHLVILPVAHMDTKRPIRTLEMTLIQRWNPSLNFPFILKKRISKIGPDYSFAVKQLASIYLPSSWHQIAQEAKKEIEQAGSLVFVQLQQARA